MAKIFITGSSDGLGLLAAQRLVADGHEVVLHGRNAKRGHEALNQVKGAIDMVTGDLSSIKETIQLADQVNELGPFDAIIHNAGVYQAPGPLIFAVNTIAPYVLTCLIQKPKRLIYMSSGMHRGGDGQLSHFDPEHTSYSDSKLHDLMLTKAVVRKWPNVYANAVDPGWVPTKMGGAGASDDLDKGYETQVWLATSNDDEARVSGGYFYHQQKQKYHAAADDPAIQERLLSLCKDYTGVSFPS